MLIPVINASESVFEKLSLADAFTVGGNDVLLSFADGVIFAGNMDSSVPEPAAWILFVLGAVGITFTRGKISFGEAGREISSIILLWGTACCFSAAGCFRTLPTSI